MADRYDLPVIPETVTVHLGAPDEPAENRTVSFPDYIKNVASSEIYPTWPEEAIRANLLAQISFALNRIYTEYYPSRGYDFDITNTTQYDQRFVCGREIYENISRLVDEMFNQYLVRRGSVQPLFASYCNGTTSTCDGLSQWGSVALAERGLTAEEILRHFYGEDVELVSDAPVAGVERSYPGVELRLGSAGEDVRILQRELNRIAENYTALPKLLVDGLFGVKTEAAVRAFQEIFGLAADGVVGKATWYAVKRVFSGVKGLSELYSEGISRDEAARVYPRRLAEGDRGEAVRVLQYYLAVISYFDERIPQVPVNGEYGRATAAGVRAFQSCFGLPATGVADRATWNRVLAVYDDTLAAVPAELLEERIEIYPGRVLTYGMQGEDVAVLQQFLRDAAARHDFLPPVVVTSVFDGATDDAVRAAQANIGLTPNGAVGPVTWSRIVRLARNDAAS